MKKLSLAAATVASAVQLAYASPINEVKEPVDGIEVVKWNTCTDAFNRKDKRPKDPEIEKKRGQRSDENPLNKEVEVYDYETGETKPINVKKFFSTHTEPPVINK